MWEWECCLELELELEAAPPAPVPAPAPAPAPEPSPAPAPAPVFGSKSKRSCLAVPVAPAGSLPPMMATLAQKRAAAKLQARVRGMHERRRVQRDHPIDALRRRAKASLDFNFNYLESYFTYAEEKLERE